MQGDYALKGSSQSLASPGSEVHLGRSNAKGPFFATHASDSREFPAKIATGELNLIATLNKTYFLILHDVSKKNNWGTLVRSASAFGCSGVIVQARKRSEVSTFGAHGADKHLPFHLVGAESDVFTYAKRQLDCWVLGVEIKPEAVSINSDRFLQLCHEHRNIAIVLGNEGTGMNPMVSTKCDGFIYIPHYGAGTASLNVAVAGSIVFHRLASAWALEERPRIGEKFVVERLDVEKRKSMNVCSSEPVRRGSEDGGGSDIYGALLEELDKA
jgi:tRNA(Leu) C34 or U34 (ribose-2'-O)-methylase TrmL